MFMPWAPCQIRKNADCACDANACNVFPTTDVKGNRKLAIPPCMTARTWPLTRSPWGSRQTATHVPWCMPGSLTRDGEENFPGIPGACATRNITYLARGQWKKRNFALMSVAKLEENGFVCKYMYSVFFFSEIRFQIKTLQHRSTTLLFVSYATPYSSYLMQSHYLWWLSRQTPISPIGWVQFSC